MKPRVAISVPHGAVPDRRGFAPAIVAEQLARRCDRFSSTVISAMEPGLPVHHDAEGLDCRHLGLSKAYVRMFQKLTRLDPWPLHARLAALLRSAPVDLLHVHQLEFPLQDFLRRLGCELPIIVHAHVTTQRPGPLLANAYLAVSDHVRGRLIEKGFPEERIHLVRNGVDTNRFAPASVTQRAALRRAMGIPADAPVLLFFGRKQEVKGFDIFLEVAARLLSLRSDLIVLAVGPEPADAAREASYTARQRLRQDIASSGRFLDLPGVSQDRLAGILQTADLAFLPSRAEPQGMAMVEAMAAGCMVVSTRVGGIPESIESGISGELLDVPVDVENAAARIFALFASPAERQRLIVGALQTVQQRFDWKHSATTLEGVYEQALANAPRRAVAA